jgi:hypothetical protein
MIVLALLLFLLGCAAVTAGAAMICLPAGIITGGAALIALALLLVMAAGSRNP